MKINRNGVVLIVLALLFIAPGLFAYMFHLHPQWISAVKTNKGTLLTPPQRLTNIGEVYEPPSDLQHHLTGQDPLFRPSAGRREMGDSGIEGAQWRLIYWTPGACDERCVSQVDKLARIRLALGRRFYNVQSGLWLGTQAAPLLPELAHALHTQHIQILAVHDETALPKQAAFLIVDPHHYLILRYAATVDPAAIFHDLKQLLTTGEAAT